MDIITRFQSKAIDLPMIKSISITNRVISVSSNQEINGVITEFTESIPVINLPINKTINLTSRLILKSTVQEEYQYNLIME